MVNGRCMQATTGFLTVSHRIKRLTRPSKPANGFSLAVKGGLQTRRMKIRRELHSGEGKECDLSMRNAPYPLIHRDYNGVNPPWAQSDSASVKIIAFFFFLSLFILLLFFDLPLNIPFYYLLFACLTESRFGLISTSIRAAVPGSEIARYHLSYSVRHHSICMGCTRQVPAAALLSLQATFLPAKCWPQARLGFLRCCIHVAVHARPSLAGRSYNC